MQRLARERAVHAAAGRPAVAGLAGVTLGGPVTSESLVAAFSEGLQLATLLACVGAANSLASPYRLLRTLPSVLYELGVVVTVALSFAPQATMTRRTACATRAGCAAARTEVCAACAVWRCRCSKVRSNGRSTSRRRWTAAATAAGAESPSCACASGRATTLAGALAIVIGVFGVLDSSAPVRARPPRARGGRGRCSRRACSVAKRAAIRSRVPARRVARAGVADDARRAARRSPRSSSPVTSVVAAAPGVQPARVADPAAASPTIGVLVAAAPGVR